MRLGKQPKVALALGGGGARGLAHIGILQVFQRENIPIDLIVGTSGGALVGARFAVDGDANEVERSFVEFMRSDLVKTLRLESLRTEEKGEGRAGRWGQLKSLLRKGVFYGISIMQSSFISEEDFVHDTNSLIPELQADETKIPFVAIATDLNAGSVVCLQTGSLRENVRASCAVPGIFPPVVMNGKVLVDGGMVSRVPVHPARNLGADFIIAINTSTEAFDPSEYTKGIDIILRANLISRHMLTKIECKKADFLIQPDLSDIHWAEFHRIDESIEAGRKAAQEAVPALREALFKFRVRKTLLFWR